VFIKFLDKRINQKITMLLQFVSTKFLNKTLTTFCEQDINKGGNQFHKIQSSPLNTPKVF